MLTRLIDLCLRHPATVLALSAVVAVAGIVSLTRLPVDAFPDTTPVMVQVNAPAPGLGPLEVEQQITFPVEQAIAGMPGLTDVRSISKSGLSQITAIFEDGIDVYLARQIIGERLRQVDLPHGFDPPALGPVSTGLGEIFHYRLVGDGHTLEELRTIHDWVVKPRLRSVPGIAEINTWGGQEKQYQVVSDPQAMVRYGISLDDVVSALERNNRNAGGGFLTSGGEASIVQGVSVLDGIESVGEVVVAAVDGVPVHVHDVARVRIGYAERLGAVTAEGEGETVLGLAFMLSGENSRDVTHRIKERVREVAAALPEGVRILPVYDRTHLVDLVLETVRENLLVGAALVIGILLIFLGELRAGLIVAVAIPLSFLFAANLMLRFGVAASLMSLGALDFGLIVDSSVILIENAARRLRMDRTGRAVRDIVRDAAVEVRKPTLFGEMIIMIVYLPILTLEGIEGKLFRPMALTVVFALLGSMLFSVTLMPVLASLFLRRGKDAPEGCEGTPVERVAQRIYRPILGWALSRGRLVLAGAILALCLGGLLSLRLGSEFVPRLSEMAITINTIRATGISLEESVRYGTAVEQTLKKAFPDEIDHIWTRTGTAEVATDAMGVELSDVFITLAPRKQWARAKNQSGLVTEMEREVADLPGMRAVFTQPIEMRVNEMVAGGRSDVALKLFGDDLDTLRAVAATLADALSLVPGAADVVVEQITGQPILEIAVDRSALGRHGLDAESVLRLVEARVGVDVGDIREGQQRFPLVVRLDPETAGNIEALKRVTVGLPGGGSVPAGEVITVREYQGPSTVTREWGRRRVAVSINVRGRDIGSFVNEAKDICATVTLPEGYYLKWGGQFEHLVTAGRRLMLIVPVALLLVLFLLYVTYGRWRDALRVFAGVPFAAVGGILALWLRGMPFSVSAGVGFIALSGVAVLGDMVLVSFIRQRLKTGITMDAAVREAAESRLRPVLMTALVAAFGFLPMALNSGVGAEVQKPLATVVIGGLVSSTLLTLIVLPVLYTRLSGRPSREVKE